MRKTTRTYKLSADVVSGVDGLAKHHSIGQSDLVDFLLEYSLEAVENGDLPIITRPSGLRVLQRPGATNSGPNWAARRVVHGDRTAGPDAG